MGFPLPSAKCSPLPSCPHPQQSCVGTQGPCVSRCRREQTLCEEYGNQSTESNLGRNPECSISVTPVVNQENAREYSWESHICQYLKQQEQQLAPVKAFFGLTFRTPSTPASVRVPGKRSRKPEAYSWPRCRLGTERKPRSLHPTPKLNRATNSKRRRAKGWHL